MNSKGPARLIWDPPATVIIHGGAVVQVLNESLLLDKRIGICRSPTWIKDRM